MDDAKDQLFFVKMAIAETNSSYNWVMGSAGAFVISMITFAAAEADPNGGRFLIFLPFFCLFWLGRSVVRIIQNTRFLKRESVRVGLPFMTQISQQKKILSWVSWAIAIGFTFPTFLRMLDYLAVQLT